MDDPDSEGVGVGGRPEHLLNASRHQGALVGSIDALKDTNERRLAGAVLAHEREDFARAHRERHVIERADHPETLRDAQDGQRGRRFPRASVAALASIAGIAARRFATPPRRVYL